MDGLDGRAGGRTDGRPAGDGKTCPDALAAVDQSPTVYPSDLGARAHVVLSPFTFCCVVAAGSRRRRNCWASRFTSV